MKALFDFLGIFHYKSAIEVPNGFNFIGSFQTLKAEDWVCIFFARPLRGLCSSELSLGTKKYIWRLWPCDHFKVH